MFCCLSTPAESHLSTTTTTAESTTRLFPQSYGDAYRSVRSSVTVSRLTLAFSSNCLVDVQQEWFDSEDCLNHVHVWIWITPCERHQDCFGFPGPCPCWSPYDVDGRALMSSRWPRSECPQLYYLEHILWLSSNLLSREAQIEYKLFESEVQTFYCSIILKSKWSNICWNVLTVWLLEAETICCVTCTVCSCSIDWH